MRILRLVAAGLVATSVVTPFLGRETLGVFTSTTRSTQAYSHTGEWPLAPAVETTPDHPAD